LAEPHLAGPFSASISPDRARIREALMALVVDRGMAGATVDTVLGRAGVARSSFDRDFPSIGDCCLQVYLANIDEFDRVVFGELDLVEGWRRRLRTAAYSAARYVNQRPIETRFDMVQMLAAGDLAQAHRDRYVNRIIDLIDEGRQELEDPDSMTRDVAVAVFGSIYQMLQKALSEGRGRDPESVVPELMYIAVRPYLGPEVAAEELTFGGPDKSAHE
jgi:AcrR family transcriptional regulator